MVLLTRTVKKLSAAKRQPLHSTSKGYYATRTRYGCIRTSNSVKFRTRGMYRLFEWVEKEMLHGNSTDETKQNLSRENAILPLMMFWPFLEPRTFFPSKLMVIRQRKELSIHVYGTLKK